jgi:hypothetical protein
MRARDPELEEEAMAIARGIGREADPSYWKRKYFELLANETRRRHERDSWLGMLVAGVAVGAPLLLLKWLFHW